MALRELLLPWDSQPQEATGVAVDAATGLVALWNASNNVNESLGAPVAFDGGTGITVTPGPGGIARAFSGGTGKLTTSIPGDTAQCTFVFTLSNFSRTAALGRILSTFNGTGGHDIFMDTGLFTFQEFFGSVNAQHTIAAVGASDAAVTVAVAMYGAVGVAPVVYVDGLQVTVTTAAAGSGSRIAGGRTLGIACRPDTNTRQFSSGRLYGAAMFDRALSPAELQAVSGSPWQLFESQRIYIPGAVVGGGNTIAVPAGALVLAGFAPVVSATANQTIAVPAGTLTLSAFAPTIGASAGNTIAVPAGALTLAGLAPVVTATANNSIAVPAGALTLAGFAPVVGVSSGAAIAVPAGALSLTAYAPDVSASTNYVSVPAGALTITGFAPTVSDGAASGFIKYFDVLSGRLLILRAL